MFGACLGLIGAVIAAVFYLNRPAPPVTPANSTRPPAVVGLGYLEPSSSVVHIGAPGSADALRIGALNVAEGDQVEQGQVLAVLDTADRLAAEVAASEQQVKLKRLILQRQQHDIASAITAKRSALDRARAEHAATKAEYDRQRTLLDRGVTTTATIEKKERELRSAEANIREMEAALTRIEMQTSANPSKEGRNIEGTQIDVAVSAQEVATAEADLAVARAKLELATVRAPFKGRILAIKSRAGERIGSEGVLELGATDVMRAVIEVYQTDIGRVRIGQPVSIRTEVLDRPLAGTVERISPTVKRQSVINNDPATATDSRVIEVFVSFDEATSRQIATLSRLQVRAVFEP